LTSIMIGNSVTRIGDMAFYNCFRLNAVIFQGNAPSLGSYVFFNDPTTRVYYLPGTTGWALTFGGLPTAVWNPVIQASGPGFGVGKNGFGFTITGTPGIPIVVEASISLPTPGWTSLQTCTLTNGSIHFSDPQWPNYPTRFYRVRWP
jgi:hypothetical protein